MTRKEFEDARDAAMVLCGVGGIFLFISVGLLLVSLIVGYGSAGWFAYYAGPTTLLLALCLIAPGLYFRKRTSNMSRDPDGGE